MNRLLRDLINAQLLSQDQAEWLVKERLPKKHNTLYVIVELFSQEFLTENELVKFMCLQYGIPFWQAYKRASLETTRLIPFSVAKSNRLVPLSHTENTIDIAMVDPGDTAAIEAVECATQRSVNVFVSTYTVISNEIDFSYSELQKQIVKQGLENLAKQKNQFFMDSED